MELLVKGTLEAEKDDICASIGEYMDRRGVGFRITFNLYENDMEMYYIQRKLKGNPVSKR